MLLRLRPWRRGPLLLLRRPGVALALAAAGFVAAMPAAAAPLFLSSAQDATLHHELASTCRWDTGVSVHAAAPFGRFPETASMVDAQQHAAAAATAGISGLTAPVSTLGATVTVTGTSTLAVNLLSRTGFRGHIISHDSTTAPGLWLPDGLARALGVHAGDRMTVGDAPTVANQGHISPDTASVPVAGVYTDLRTAPTDPYWCSLKLTWQGQPGHEDAVRPTVLAEPAVFDQLGDQIPGVGGAHWIEYAVASPQRLGIDHATRLAGQATKANSRIRLAATMSETFVDARTSLPAFVARAKLVRSGLLPPVVPITATGVLVGLLVVAAAAVFWAERRARELRVLAAHGVSAGGLGLKAVTEASTALLAGALAGAGSAWLLVGGIGPDARLTTESVPVAALAALATLLVGIATVGGVAALRCRALTDERRPDRRVRAHHIPWELVLVAGGIAAWAGLSGDTQLVDTATNGVGSVAHVPARLLVVPILLIAGVTALAARLGLVALRWQRRRRPTRPASLLAWRRLAREATAAAVLAAAVGLPMALATYGVSVIGSVRDTTAAQARMVVGTDLVVALSEPTKVPAALGGRATTVVRLDQVLVGGVLCDTLAVDPATFGRGVDWDSRINSPSPATLAHQLAGRAAVGTGEAPTGPNTFAWGARDMGSYTLRHTALLPGAQGYPVVLVDRSTIDPALLARGAQQLWIRGDAQSARAALAAVHAPVKRYNDAADLYSGTLYEPVTYTFGYLIALSVLTGVVTLVGLLLYLESRTGGHRRAYVLLSRMGLTPAGHRRALVTELAVPLVAGIAVGVATAYGMIRLLGPDFDVNAVAPPDALVALPVAVVGWIAAAAAAVAVAAGLLTHRRIDRANPAEVLRDTI